MARGFFLPNDWERSPLRKILKKKVVTVDHANFTDGGGAAGTIDLGFDIPANSYFLFWNYQIKEAFSAGGSETTVTLTFGDGSDADRFCPTTDPAITIATQTLDTRNYVSPEFGTGGSGDGVLHVSAAVSTPTLTATLSGGTPDWTGVLTGQLKIEVVYFNLLEIFNIAEEIT